ncbi:MAG: response regulator [Pseudomonadota bacterium]
MSQDWGAEIHTHPADGDDMLLAERVGLLFSYNYLAAIGCATAALLIYLALRGDAAMAQAGEWLFAVLALEGVRLVMTALYKRGGHKRSSQFWANALTAWSLAGGLIWAFLPALFLSGANLQQAGYIILFTVGIAAGSALVYATYLPAALAFIVPISLSLAYCFFLMGTAQSQILAAVIVLYTAFLCKLAHQFQGFMVDFIRRRMEKEKLAGRLHLALAEADAARETQKRMTANISHEIRTPMNAVIGMIELAKKASQAAEKNQYLAIAGTAAQGLLGLINDLLDLARLEQGRIELKAAPFDANALIAEIEALMRPEAARKGLGFAIETSLPAALWLEGDRGRIRQIIVNLLGNAIKFTDAGEIGLRVGLVVTGRSEAELHISITDTGIGVAEADQERIFERFQRANSAGAAQRTGSGLGLAIVRELMTVMNGRLALHSQLGKGSRFELAIPCLLGTPLPEKTPQAEAAPSAPPISPAPVPASKPAVGPASSQPHVFIVDDNEMNCVLIQALLANAGLTSEVASNGLAALNRLEQEQGRPFDVVLMDISMPQMDGIEATRHIRALANDYRDIAVIAVTAHAYEEQKDECLAAGMDGFVVKPIDIELLVAEINRVLEKPGKRRQRSA